MIVIYHVTITPMIIIKSNICHRTRDNDFADDDTITEHMTITTTMMAILKMMNKQED